MAVDRAVDRTRSWLQVAAHMCSPSQRDPGRFHFRTLRTQAVTVMHTSSTVPIATPAMMPAMVRSARSAS